MKKKSSKPEDTQTQQPQLTVQQIKNEDFVAEIFNLSERKEKLALNKEALEVFNSQLNCFATSTSLIIGLSDETRRALNLSISKLKEDLCSATYEVRRAISQTNSSLYTKLSTKE